MKIWLSNIACRIGKYLAKTQFGVFIIAHSYVHENYEWYRELIFNSGYSLEEIQECIRQKDHTGWRSDWLFSRSKYTGQHCTDAELEELITYLDVAKNDNSEPMKTDNYINDHANNFMNRNMQDNVIKCMNTNMFE